jgi:hypothetical protein
MKAVVIASGLSALIVSCAPTDTGKPHLKNPVRYESWNDGPITEGRRALSGRINFQKGDYRGTTKVIVTPRFGPPVEGHLEEANDLIHVDFDRQYRVEFLTWTYAGNDYVFNDVLKVFDGRRLIVDTSICSIHQIPMERRLGNEKSLGEYPNSFFPLQRERFLYDGNTYLMSNTGLKRPVWRCPTCAELYLAWEKKNPGHY